MSFPSSFNIPSNNATRSVREDMYAFEIGLRCQPSTRIPQRVAYLRLSSSFRMIHSVFERLHCVQSLSPGGTTHYGASAIAPNRIQSTYTYPSISTRRTSNGSSMPLCRRFRRVPTLLWLQDLLALRSAFLIITGTHVVFRRLSLSLHGGVVLKEAVDTHRHPRIGFLT